MEGEIQKSDFIYTTLVILTPIILAFLSLKFLRKRNLHKHGVRERKYHPIAGTMFHQLLNFNRLHHYMTDLAAKYKTYRLLAPFRNEIYTVDPANVEYILKTNFANYGKGDYNHDNLTDLLGDGIFAVDGEKWRNQRKVSSYEFSTRVLRDYSSITFGEKVVKLANIISDAANSNQIIDIQDLFMKSTLDSIFKVGFGVDLDTMCGTNDEGKRFSQAFDEASAICLYRYVDALWPIKKFLNIGSEAKLKKSLRSIDAFVYKLIDNKAELMKNSQENFSMKKDDILSRFMQQDNIDHKYLRDIILNFVIAGKDTTATSLSWFIYMLCKHPEVAEKVAEEVRRVINTEGVANPAQCASYLSEESLEKMQYLHIVLNETLRLYPAVPVDPKTCFSDDVLPDGYSVSKGDLVFYQPYAMARMKFIWGEDAEDFRPERWLNKDGIFQPESPFKFTTFQAGPRVCIGKDFAYRQMKIFCAVLVNSFIFKLGDENNIVNYKPMLTLHIDGGLHVRALPRK